MQIFKRLIFAVLAYLMISCSSDNLINTNSNDDDLANTQQEITTLTSNTKRNLTPNLTNEDIADIVNSNNMFAHSLYSKLSASCGLSAPGKAHSR